MVPYSYWSCIYTPLPYTPTLNGFLTQLILIDHTHLLRLLYPETQAGINEWHDHYVYFLTSNSLHHRDSELMFYYLVAGTKYTYAILEKRTIRRLWPWYMGGRGSFARLPRRLWMWLEAVRNLFSVSRHKQMLVLPTVYLLYKSTK